jgi:hypothetical protein
MSGGRWIAGAALLALGTALAAQDAPESLLPPGFEKPKPATPAPAATSSPVVQPIPTGGEPRAARAPATAAKLPANLPSLRELEAMSPDELDELFGLKTKVDIPPAARRALERVGVLASWEGGLPSGSLAGQGASLVAAAIAGNNGQTVSRWGHILLRRALVSRLDAPAGMAPADFAALRAALLVRMGEGAAARSLVQDVDPGNYSPLLTQAALDAYVQTADITGVCPVVGIVGGARKDADWRVMQAICGAFSGDSTASLTQLDRLRGAGVWPNIDMLLAQKYAGAAGKARRAVTIEWDGVNTLTPWRYALTVATGLTPPEKLTKDMDLRYWLSAATAPMVPLVTRAEAADRAAAVGVLSSAAMVDLYGQIYAEDDIAADWNGRAETLRNAYVAASPADRLAAMKSLWSAGVDPHARYSRLVLTAYAAARLPVSEDLGGDADDLVASMLAAGLDQNALRWAGVVDQGSPAWMQLALAAPNGTRVGAATIEDFRGDDQSEGKLKTRFLVAGLAGLGRVDPGTARSILGALGVNLDRQTKWSNAIDAAAAVNNQALVALLAGLGMQGSGWDKMTTVNLYHIVSALDRVGLKAEARMIAAEAVARG